MSEPVRPGQRVVWRPGVLGRDRRVTRWSVPAVVVRVAAKRVQIEIHTAAGEPVLRWVPLEYLEVVVDE